MIANGDHENTDVQANSLSEASGLARHHRPLDDKVRRHGYVTASDSPGQWNCTISPTALPWPTLTFTELVSTRKTSAAFSLLWERKSMRSHQGDWRQQLSDRIACMWAGIEATP